MFFLFPEGRGNNALADTLKQNVNNPCEESRAVELPGVYSFAVQ